MTTDEDLEAAQDAGIESATTHALLVEAVRTVRRVERRTVAIADDQIRQTQAIIRLDARAAEHDLRLKTLEQGRRQASLADAEIVLREKAADDRIRAMNAENRDKNLRTVAMFVAALLGIAARFALGGHHP